MTDTCKVCDKPIAEWFNVCSPACAGRLGGLKKVPKGFACMDREKVVAAGRLGGSRSKRRKHEE